MSNSHRVITHISFDLDGTLVDCCDLHFNAFNYAIECIDGKEFILSYEEHLKNYNALSTIQKIGKYLENTTELKQEKIQRLYGLKQEYTKSHLYEFVKKDERIKELIHYLDLDRYHLSCVTNSIKQTTHTILEILEIKSYFSCIISNEDVITPKPHPEGYLRSMAYLGKTPLETLIIEDSEKGIEAASKSCANVMTVKDSSYVTLENIQKCIEKIKKQ